MICINPKCHFCYYKDEFNYFQNDLKCPECGRPSYNYPKVAISGTSKLERGHLFSDVIKSTMNIATIIIFLLLFSGCYVSKISWRLGMSEQEFIDKNRRAIEIEEASSYRTVYKTCNYYGCTFFYFKGRTLNQVDRGDQAPDILIKN